MQIDIEALKAELVREKGRWAEIARAGGMSYSWLSKFANDHIPNPGIRSLRKLDEALHGKPDPKRKPGEKRVSA